MDLDERLNAARSDYRNLPSPPLLDSDRRPSVPARPPRRWPAVAAVAALMVAAVGIAVVVTAQRGGDGGGDGVNAATTPTPVSDPGITVEPAGELSAGQQVTVKVDSSAGADLVNGGVEICSSLKRQANSPLILCDRLPTTAARDGLSATVVLSGGALTPGGWQVCGLTGDVSCWLQVRTDEGQLRSAPLSFAAASLSSLAGPTLTASLNDDGRFEITSAGLAPDPTWLDIRRQNPAAADALPALTVAVCAFDGPSEPTEAPDGSPLTSQWIAQGATNCDVLGAPFVIDPDRPNEPQTVTIPRLLYGPAGWSDCTVSQCGLLVTSATENELADGGVGGSTAAVAATLLDTGTSTVAPAGWDEARRPTISVETEGPVRPGDTVSVAIADLRAGTQAGVQACDIGVPDGWCGGAPGRAQNETVDVAIPADCPVTSCVVAITAPIKGIAPLVVAKLDLED